MHKDFWTPFHIVFYRLLHQGPILEIAGSDKDTNSGDGRPIMRWKRLFKSGKVCTADTLVLHKIIWPHELVYTAKG